MKFVTLDFETRYDDEYSLKKLAQTQYLTDPRFKVLGVSLKVDDGPVVYFNEEQAPSALLAIKPQLEQAFVLCHHAQFDGFILAYHFGIRPAMFGCTMAMARALKLEIEGGASLEAMMGKFELGSKGHLSPTSSEEELRIRATVDTQATFDLFGIFIRAYSFPHEELKVIDWTIRAYTDPIIVGNQAKLLAVRTEYDAKMNALLDRLQLKIEDLRSDGMLASAFNALGIEAPLKPSKNKNTPGKTLFAFAKTDEEFVELLESEDEDVAMLAEGRLMAKGAGEANKADRFLYLAKLGLMPVYLSHAATHTLRWAGGDKCNWQNQKRGGRIREALEAPPGFGYCVGDLAQIEARFTAWLCQCMKMLAAFADPLRDVYSEFGTLAFQRAVSRATEYERFSSKTVVLGAGFGAGGYTIFQQMRAEIRKRQMSIPIPTEETATMLVQHYRAQFPEIPTGWRVLETLLGKAGATFGPIVSTGDTFRLPNGLALRFVDLNKEQYQWRGETEFGWRYDTRRGRVPTWGGKLMENCASSLARALIAWQLVRMEPEIRALGGKIATMTHDEMVAVAPCQNLDTVKQIMQHWMTQGPEWTAGLPIHCEVDTGMTYASAK